MFEVSHAAQPTVRSGFIGLCLIALAMQPTVAMAQDGTPLTIEADDVLEWNQTDGS